MTRINLVDPAVLCDQHLLAEFRELTRIPNAVLGGKFKSSEIPVSYTVRTNDNQEGGKGHVLFFTNKLKFLHIRYESLYRECQLRKLNVTYIWPNKKFSAFLYRGYYPTEKEIQLNKKRIQERRPKNPRWSTR